MCGSWQRAHLAPHSNSHPRCRRCRLVLVQSNEIRQSFSDGGSLHPGLLELLVALSRGVVGEREPRGGGSGRRGRRVLKGRRERGVGEGRSHVIGRSSLMRRNPIRREQEIISPSQLDDLMD